MWMSSGSRSDTCRIKLPRSMLISALRWGAPSSRRDAPTVAATSTIVSAGESLTA